jgi:hypothetical protein
MLLLPVVVLGPLRPAVCAPALAPLLALAACTAAAPAEECRLNSDCVAPLLCQGGQCRPECREDRDCEDGFGCVDSVCERRIPPARICTRSGDCRNGETCQGGVCQAVGIVDRPPPSDAGVPGPSDAGPAPAPDAGSGALPYGAVCGAPSDCQSRICVGRTGPGTMGRCSLVCASDTECVYPDRCREVPGEGRFCQVASTPGATGSPCPGGPDDCATGICLEVGGGSPSICTHQCSPLPSCPSGLTCQPVADGAGGAVPVCIPGSGGGFGQGCARATDCATGLCVGDPSSGQGLCTAFCDQVPCPLGFACASVQDGQGGVSRVCAPEGLTGGGFGSPCTGASSCTSGLCLNDARTGGSFCTIACRSPADCRAVAGLTCVVLQGGAQVCGPP